jgi:hypothetical protein
MRSPCHRSSSSSNSCHARSNRLRNITRNGTSKTLRNNGRLAINKECHCMDSQVRSLQIQLHHSRTSISMLFTQVKCNLN